MAGGFSTAPWFLTAQLPVICILRPVRALDGPARVFSKVALSAGPSLKRIVLFAVRKGTASLEEPPAIKIGGLDRGPCATSGLGTSPTSPTDVCATRRGSYQVLIRFYLGRFNRCDFLWSGFLGFAVEKRDHLLVGLEWPVRLASFRLFQGLSEAGIDDPTLGRSVFAVNNHFWRENDLAPFCFGFHQVAINQAHLEAKPGGNGHLSLALHFNNSAHGDQFPEVGSTDFLK
jgi:hypothetical protein